VKDTKTEKVKIPNNKGRKIAAIIHRPNKECDKLAILCPGFLDTKDYAHLVTLARALSARGFTVIRFDPTGTWESEGDISEYLTSQYLEDIKSVLEYMLGKASYEDILLGGHSRGGMVSILYAARDKRISTVLGIMPSTPGVMKGKRHEEWKETGFSNSFRDIPGSVEKKFFKVPYAHNIDRQQFDIFTDVRKIHAPLILVAGELDTAVPPEDVKRIFDTANEPKQYILMKGIGHDYRNNPSEIDIVNDKILEILPK
jgi:alpha-beta hydrolase superfamily lysophospholipase